MSRARSFFESFTELRRLPPALWIVIGAFVLESSAYFGVLTLMTSYLSTDFGWGDKYAGLTVSLFTMLVTLFMLGFGSMAESFGLRRAIAAALLICTLGRLLFTLPVFALEPGSVWARILPSTAIVTVAVLGALAVTAVGEAIIQPVCYSGVKQYTDEKTSSMGYGLIYAIMNLGIVGIGTLSAWIRPAVQNLLTPEPGRHYWGEDWLQPLANISVSGVQAVIWVCTGLTALTLLAFLLVMNRRTEAAKLRPDVVETAADGGALALRERWRRYFLEGPFTNPRFVFFIFMLLPVRTLFAHQWLTMPQYILRAYDQKVVDYDRWLAGVIDVVQHFSGAAAGLLSWLAEQRVADLMEWLVNWINPAIIFIGVPITTALTRRANVYTMMILGSLVSAAPTFLLCLGPDLNLLVIYFVVFSIGEALWSARFLEYASELAPPGRVAQYMGLAQVPWLLAKGTTGFYSGWMLATYCPKDIPPADLHTGTLWFIYGCIAMTSPFGLWLARKWVLAGLYAKT